MALDQVERIEEALMPHLLGYSKGEFQLASTYHAQRFAYIMVIEEHADRWSYIEQYPKLIPL